MHTEGLGCGQQEENGFSDSAFSCICFQPRLWRHSHSRSDKQIRWLSKAKLSIQESAAILPFRIILVMANGLSGCRCVCVCVCIAIDLSGPAYLETTSYFQASKINILFFVLFWLYAWHTEVPGPGMESEPQQ